MPQEDPAQIWMQCLSVIKEMVHLRTFDTWFKPTKGYNLTQDTFTIQVPSQFFLDWLEEHHHDRIKQVLVRQLGREVFIDFRISKDQQAITPVHTRPVSYMPTVSQQRPQEEMENKLYDDYTFDHFVVGECNEYAHAASLAVVKSPGQSTFNPLVIYGGVGLGKTHLTQAIAHESIKQGTIDRFRYVSSEKFYIEFIESIQDKKTKEFAQTYRNVDMLLVDDIQFFCRGQKTATQEEFFHTFDVLRQNGKQIVLTSDRIPKELSGLEERLMSRFEWGLLADIRPPDFETRVAILQKKAAKDGVSIASDVIAFVADHFTSNIRELEGAVLSLLAYSSLSQRDISIDVAREVLNKKIQRKKRDINIEDIKRAVAKYYTLPLEVLSAKTRRKEIVLARQVAMYLSRKILEEPLKEIGSNFGGRDHTTVIHACQVIENIINRDHEFQGTLDQIKRSIK
jgi:chromosomal replication initiator protein